MHFDIPFSVNTQNNCGPIALQMVFASFGDRHPFEEIQRLTASETSGITFTNGLMYAAVKLGYAVELYSAHIAGNPQNFELRYYQEMTDGPAKVKGKIAWLTAESIRLGARVEERTLSIEEIKAKLSDDCRAIVLLDWSKISGKEDFRGHFVPITGFDDTHLSVHDSGPRNPTPDLQLTSELFDKARTAKGTDQDILFIHRK